MVWEVKPLVKELANKEEIQIIPVPAGAADSQRSKRKLFRQCTIHSARLDKDKGKEAEEEQRQKTRRRWWWEKRNGRTGTGEGRRVKRHYSLDNGTACSKNQGEWSMKKQ